MRLPIISLTVLMAGMFALQPVGTVQAEDELFTPTHYIDGTAIGFGTHQTASEMQAICVDDSGPSEMTEFDGYVSKFMAEYDLRKLREDMCREDRIEKNKKARLKRIEDALAKVGVVVVQKAPPGEPPFGKLPKDFDWDVEPIISEMPPTSTMTITLDEEDGGTFDSSIPVTPTFEFLGGEEPRTAGTIPGEDEKRGAQLRIQDDFTWLKGNHTMQFGGGINRLFNPDITIGDTYSDFDNDWTVPVASLAFRPSISFNGLSPFFQINGGKRSDTENKGDSNTTGNIAWIDGSNFSGPVLFSQNRRLKLDHYNIGGQAGLEGRFNGVDVYAGLLLAHSDYEYRLTELAAGFTHNLDMDLSSGFYGTKLGIGKSWSFNNVIISGNAWGAGGYNHLKLDAKQGGNLFGGPGAVNDVKDTEKKFAVRSGFNIDFSMPIGERAFFSVGGFGSVDSAAPNINFPVAGSGNRIQADSKTGYNAGGFVGVTIPFGGSGDDSVEPRRFMLSPGLRF